MAKSAFLFFFSFASSSYRDRRARAKSAFSLLLLLHDDSSATFQVACAVRRHHMHDARQHRRRWPAASLIASISRSFELFSDGHRCAVFGSRRRRERAAPGAVFSARRYMGTPPCRARLFTFFLTCAAESASAPPKVGAAGSGPPCPIIS